MRLGVIRTLLPVVSLVASGTIALAVSAPPAHAAGSLSSGSLTMVSTLADGTSGPALPSTAGADHEAISDDGKVIAFTSPVPAEKLVTDPTQTGHVNDTNGVDDVFVWDSRVPAPAGPIVSLVSQNSAKTGTGDAASKDPIMAPHGIGVVFSSAATNLTSVPVGASSNHLYAWAPVISSAVPVFMIDENYQGTAGSNSISSDPSIAVTLVPPSVRVAFTSSGSDLVDPNVHKALGSGQVYVRTLTLPSPSTQMVSLDSSGKDGTVSGASEPEIAADGDHVVFSSGGDDLIGTVNPPGTNIYVRSLAAQTTKLISASGGSPTSGNNSPVISGDGQAVAWDSNDTTLSVTPHLAAAHVFYRMSGGPVLMVDTDFTGVSGCNSASNWPGISLDGTMVDYESSCTDSAPPGMTDSGTQVFARRMEPASPVPALPDAAPQLISTNDAGTGSGNADAALCPGSSPPQCGASSDPSVTMNADGTAIVFMSQSSNIGAPASTPPFNDGSVYVRYPYAKPSPVTVPVSFNKDGKFSDSESRDPVISADGGSVAFVSLADDFGVTDTNGATDVFESDIHNPLAFQPIAAVQENAGSVTITVARGGTAATVDTIEVKTGDGSTPDLPTLPAEITNPGGSNATQPGDYTSEDHTLTFPAGVKTETFTVPITNDSTPEDPEVFHVSLSSPGGAASIAAPGPLSESYVVILDDDPPTVTINQASAQADPTSTSPIHFTTTFSTAVTGFDASDVVLSGTAGGTLAAVVTGGPTTYDVAVSGMTTGGTVIATVPAHAAQNSGSTASAASTSTDNTVTWAPVVDTTPPDVTINQGSSQADPTSTSPIHFTASFSEPVSGFDGSDVVMSGTAGGTLASVVTGGPSVYDVSVSGMTTSGTVVATVPAGAAQDAAANPSTASTATDNTVSWVSTADTTPPDVTINQGSSQADPTSTSPIVFTASFSEPVTGFDINDVVTTGSTAGGSLVSAVTGGPTIYSVSISGMTTAGSVVATIPAGAAQDAAANPSTASTSTDHTVSWAPSKVTSTVGVVLSPTATVFGQNPTTTATVTPASGSAIGTVQFAVDGANAGSPVILGAAGTATSAALTGLSVGMHAVTAVFTPTDTTTYATANGSGSITVSKASTATTMTVAAHALTATVAALAPGAGTPTGTVTFSVDGSAVGTASLASGTATLSYTTPNGMMHALSAAYAGDASFAASSASTSRNDPALTAKVTSAHPKTKYGWYRDPVTITFTCTTNGAPLVGGCPTKVTLNQGGGQSVSRTINASDGGVSTVNVTGINIDSVWPLAKITGVANGGHYLRPAPGAHCTGTDALSGVVTCSTLQTIAHHGDTDVVSYAVTATDRAGNVGKTAGTYTISTVLIAGATFSDGAYTVHRGQTYTLLVNAGTQPRYYDAAPYPQTPFKKDRLFYAAGPGQWRVAVLMESKLRSHTLWNIGVKIGATMHVVEIRVLP